ncbi:transcriptional repressor LexA [Neglectibacter timonensis]|uniref:LexA repressor n=1 Tax=Neglectibacter timonensis TaxID=1776382 RepID=A0ABT1S3W8_9FIRM|nr:transcriptional repressor LexA [Neglectibacter timonensis]MCQ4841637.1 transcriptional repressor LexA [Neglectibacter timonensis]MCQ4845293.1 transcriptional repressor LexA [Neglectibacter timonensis]MEE0731012.1 transcriptional repressor LexA [Oscillospiraceae bacterium]
MDHLTKSQQKVYDFLRKEAPRGVPPTVREICAATGLRSTSTVHAHLKTLERLGYITRDAGLNRSIRLEGSEAAAQVPILGKVTAGIPILAVEDIEGYIPFPQKEGKELFALHVSGLSMRDAGILDGDYVVAEKTPTSSDGEIVVAMIEEEATVKRFYREGSRIRLQPENPDFEPIYAENVFILGKVIAVVRYY